MSSRKHPLLFEPDPEAQPERQPADDVIVREVRCKSLLNRCTIDDYSFNCYVGCGHRCRYCYARFMQRFHPHTEEWGRFVDVKINAVEILARQLRRLPPGSVFTCSACDGWQPVEEHYRADTRMLPAAAGRKLPIEHPDEEPSGPAGLGHPGWSRRLPGHDHHNT
jgi:hypothetical protein